MGKGGGGGVPGPTEAEIRQTNLQNQLLQQQIDQAIKDRQEWDRTHSVDYLNQQRQDERLGKQRDYLTAKNAQYETAANNIRNAWKDLGNPEGAKPYLDALKADYDKLQYHAGNDYTETTTPYTADNFDEQAYLAQNPDVAKAIAYNKTLVGPDGAPSGAFTSGWEHFQQYGKGEGRGFTTRTNPSADYFDDPTTLTTKDYGSDTAISGIRTGRRDTAYNTAEGTGTTRLQNMGLDADTTKYLQGLFDTKLNTLKDTAGTASNDYSGTFDPDAVLNSVLDTERTARRGGYTTQARSAFNGYDPTSDFSDTADDKYINDIVGRQYDDAFSSLQRARARGALTDQGYNAGLSYLGEQRGTANSTAQTLGGAVLTRDRTALSDIKDRASTDAGAWDFGGTFDTNKYLTDYANKRTDLSSNLGSDISSALAGQNWFNVGDVLSKAGYAQGAQNTKSLASGYDTPALSALDQERDRRSSNSRGLGGTGVF